MALECTALVYSNISLCILLSNMSLKDQTLQQIGKILLLNSEEDVFKFVFQGLVLQASSDEAETLLLKDVEKILKSLSAQGPGLTACDRDGRRNANLAHGCMKRIVISHLQKLGYNAAICKSRWDHSGALSAGMNNNNLLLYHMTE